MRVKVTNWTVSSDRAGVREAVVSVRPIYGGYTGQKGVAVELRREAGEFRHEHLRIELHRETLLDLLVLLAVQLPETTLHLGDRPPERAEIFRALRLAFPTSEEVLTAQMSAASPASRRGSPGASPVALPWPGPPRVEGAKGSTVAKVIPLQRARERRRHPHPFSGGRGKV